MAAPVPEPPWWRQREEAQRRPLTRDAIVEAALVVLEREGMNGLSMRKVAEELGTGAASLYWHVRDKEELLSLRRDAAQISLGRIPAGPNSLPVMERNLAVAAASGLPPRVIALATDMFALYVGAFAYEESLRVPSASAEQLAEYFRSLPPERFPNIVALAEDLTAGDQDERFEFAIELLVRGLEAMGRQGT
jgi:AcrR family transcriptional regulator